MRTKEKVEFTGMCDSLVHHSSRRDVSRSTDLVLRIGTEKAGMMALLDHDVSDRWFEFVPEFQAGVPNALHLFVQNLKTNTFNQQR